MDRGIARFLRLALGHEALPKSIRALSVLMLLSLLACLISMGLVVLFHAYFWNFLEPGPSLPDPAYDLQAFIHGSVQVFTPLLCLAFCFLLFQVYRKLFCRSRKSGMSAAKAPDETEVLKKHFIGRMLFLAFGIVALVLMVNLVLCIGMAGNLNGAIRSVLFQISFPPNYGCA
ncbi:MAG: hypothetical protein LBG81_08065 [Coriobacteriaceae bacterium]|jgi:TRAP-type C4-dicarboxylate transport system permease small subunit|nr:hypothetical protein [Coriobacteriaceae bacterium]